MTRNDLEYFEKWFSEHTGSFSISGETDRKNISLKIQHSLNVMGNARQIASDLKLSQNEALIAETAALFHDIGRFTQYDRYKTFKDSASENHGRIGARVLGSKDTLQRLSGREQELITNTVRFHSAFSIPPSQDAEKRFFLKLVRDSDKLDIWRVFVDYYTMDKKDRTSAIGQELPDTPGYSRDVLACIHKRKMASLSRLKNLNDFKITQLSWVFDLNFSSSFRMLLDRDYLQLIIARLPQTDDIIKASHVILNFSRQRCEQPD